MPEAKTIYAESALRSLPRLLSLLDRNPLSPTFGCFHRDYWLYKTSDFPDAVRQFGTLALALAYARDFPNNPYRGNPNIRDWAIAGLTFWATIQHADGSFDEFYPYERGWVGPTAFTTYTSSESLELLRSDMRPEDVAQGETAIRHAATFITEGDAEEDHLANHHAMAILAVSAAADALRDDTLRLSLPKLWSGFLRYHDPEGWSREYDGADPGYLSATISFLGKMYARHPSDELRQILKQSVEFASYFVYPNGSYAGTVGSRNTLHFYPHGFELLSREMPLAASVAAKMAQALADGKLVPPEIMSDRYVHYRVPEYLLASLDAKIYEGPLPLLPYERPAFTKYFPNAGIAVSVHGPAYMVANLAKGGVVKTFDVRGGKNLLTDTGWVGELADGRLVSSQWIDPALQRGVEGNLWRVRGRLHLVPPPKLFTPWKHLLFRLASLSLGWYPPAAHRLKGAIRKTLILVGHPLPCRFERKIELADDHHTITDTLWNDGRLRFRRLLLGGDTSIRYVPQSRFFQSDDLENTPRAATNEELRRLHEGESLRVVRTIRLTRSDERPQETALLLQTPSHTARAAR